MFYLNNSQSVKIFGCVKVLTIIYLSAARRTSKDRIFVEAFRVQSHFQDFI